MSATAEVLVQSSITQEEWFSHFGKVFDCDSDGVADSERSDTTEAPDPDGLNGEFYKYSAHCVFNHIFQSTV